jgi:hypothetical protein
MLLSNELEIGQAIDNLYKTDRLAVHELFSAACDTPYIYCNDDVPKRLIEAGLITEQRHIPDNVKKIILGKFRWSDPSM